MRRLSFVLTAAALVSGCSLLDVAQPAQGTTVFPSDPSKTMNATIDGVVWFAKDVFVNTTSSTVRFTGVLNPGQATQRLIVIQFAPASGSPQTFGSYGGVTFAQVGVGPSNLTLWNTIADGPTGTVSFSQAGNHFVGTFSFDAQIDATDISPLVRKVVNGTFDVSF